MCCKFPDFRGKRRNIKSWSFTVLLGIFSLGMFPIIAEYGLEEPGTMNPYLNGAFPSTPPGGSEDWEVENAFPNLTFVDPLDLAELPDGDFLIAGKKGTIWRIENDPATTTKSVFLDIENEVFTWEDAGLLGLELHPEYGVSGSPNEGEFYVFYTYTPQQGSGGSDLYIRLSRFYAPPGSNVADRSSEEVLIQMYDRQDWHQGGGMFFGDDGFLYVSIGDEGGVNDQFNSTQQIDQTLFGGLLRIDVDNDSSRSHEIRRQINPAPPRAGWPQSFNQGYLIPNDNPWIDENGEILEEFYALGLRSPHRISYDSQTGNIHLGDVGQGGREEISLVSRGDNLQWPYREGNISGPKSTPANLIGTDKDPIYAYGRDIGQCIIGGFVYRGAKYASSLNGKYLFSDHEVRNVWALDYNPNTGATEINFLVNIPSEGIGGKSGVSHLATDSQGEVYIFKLFGMNRDGGKIYKLKPKNFSPEPPPLLSQTGAFANLANLTPSEGIIPYQVNSKLFSDHAVKKRWIALPNNDGTHAGTDEQIIFSETGEWTFPSGTVIIKHFELPVNENNPSQTVRLETRFVVIDKDGSLYGFTYKWRADGSDADLLFDGTTDNYTVTRSDGSQYTQTWEFPSRQACLTCHTQNAGFVLGVKTHQLNGDLTYPSTGLTANQLQSWNHLGMFFGGINEGEIPNMPASVDINDETASLEMRVRSYLDANCASCHRPGGVNANFDARFTTPTAAANLIYGSLEKNYDIPNQAVVVPQNITASILHSRDNSLGDDKMPPLLKREIDDTYIQVLEDWINSLDPGAGPQPFASFTTDPSTGIAPMLVSFDASNSSDPLGGGLNYAWDYGDGNSGTGETSEHIYINPGTYQVSLTITDINNNTSSATRSVVVNQAVPGECASIENLALAKPTTQSSIFASFSSELAVDGNTDGNLDGGSNTVTHTNNDQEAWWEVDLEAVQNIEYINVYNRTDCCQDRVSNFYVLVSDLPFTSTDLNETINQSDVLAVNIPGTALNPTRVDIDRSGRYVRVQLSDQDYLSLTEVEVMGCEYVNSCTNPPVVSLNIEDASTCDGQGRAEISYSAGSLSVQDALGNEVSGQLPDLYPGDYDWEVVDGDCRESGSFTINAPGLPVVSISPAGPFNLSDGVQQLSASPPGGVWTGTNRSLGCLIPLRGWGVMK